VSKIKAELNRKNKGTPQAIPVGHPIIDIDHLREKAQEFRNSHEDFFNSRKATRKHHLDDVGHILDATGNVVGSVRAHFKQTRADSLDHAVVIFDSSGQVVGNVAGHLMDTSGDFLEKSRKGALVIMDESGEAVGVVSKEALKTSGMVVKTTHDGAVVVRTKAEQISGADEAKTRKEYYQRLAAFFGPLLGILLLYLVLAIILPRDDAIKFILGGLAYLFAIPGFDPNTLILGAKALGINPYIMAFFIGVQDTFVGIFLCLNFDYTKRIPILGRFIADFESGGKALLAKYSWLEKFSIVGLFIFIVLPFQGCGPVGGALIGRMIGVRKLYIIISIVVGCFLAVFALAYLADFIADLLPKWLQIGIPLTIASILVIGFVYSQVKKRMAKNKDA